MRDVMPGFLIKNTFIWFSLLLLFYSLKSRAQQDQSQNKLHFTARAIGDKDSLAVMFAHVFNESTKKSVITDTSGVFSLWVDPFDTLVISAVGYYPKPIFLAAYDDLNQTPTIIVEQRMYDIAEVQVTALGSYAQFKKKVINLDLPYTDVENLQRSFKKMAYESAKDIKRRPSVAEMYNPIPEPMASVPIYSAYEKQVISYQNYLKKEKRRKLIYEKYNKDLIRAITKLEEPELTDFYAWMDLKEKWLYDASLYEIGEVIKEKYALYLAQKTDAE